MPYSVIVEDKVYDLKYVEFDHLPNAYVVYADRAVGMVTKMGKNNWTCVSYIRSDSTVFPARGFRSRNAAVEFLLRFNSY